MRSGERNNTADTGEPSSFLLVVKFNYGTLLSIMKEWLPALSLISTIAAAIFMLIAFKGDVSALFFALNYTDFSSWIVIALTIFLIVLSLIITSAIYWFFLFYIPKQGVIQLFTGRKDGIAENRTEIQLGERGSVVLICSFVIWCLSTVFLIPITTFVVSVVILSVASVVVAIVLRSVILMADQTDYLFHQRRLFTVAYSPLEEWIEHACRAAINASRSSFFAKKIPLLISLLFAMVSLSTLAAPIGLSGPILWLPQEVVIYKGMNIAGTRETTIITPAYVLDDKTNYIKIISADQLKGITIEKESLVSRMECNTSWETYPLAFFKGKLREYLDSPSFTMPILDNCIAQDNSGLTLAVKQYLLEASI